MAGSGKDAAPTDAEIATELRQLALVDRVLGLEAEIARMSSQSGARDEIARLEAELAAVYASRTWRLGSAMVRIARPRRRAKPE